jgi:hypothetical protein
LEKVGTRKLLDNYITFELSAVARQLLKRYEGNSLLFFAYCLPDRSIQTKFRKTIDTYKPPVVEFFPIMDNLPLPRSFARARRCAGPHSLAVRLLFT